LLKQARSGARVLLEHDGTLRIERGLVHPDDMPAQGKAEGAVPRGAVARIGR
jgi:hypothetical protein